MTDLSEERLRELWMTWKHERRAAEGTLEFDPECPVCQTEEQERRPIAVPVPTYNRGPGLAWPVVATGIIALVALIAALIASYR